MDLTRILMFLLIGGTIGVVGAVGATALAHAGGPDVIHPQPTIFFESEYVACALRRHKHCL